MRQLYTKLLLECPIRSLYRHWCSNIASLAYPLRCSAPFENRWRWRLLFLVWSTGPFGDIDLVGRGSIGIPCIYFEQYHLLSTVIFISTWHQSHDICSLGLIYEAQCYCCSLALATHKHSAAPANDICGFGCTGNSTGMAAFGLIKLNDTSLWWLRF